MLGPFFYDPRMSVDGVESYSPSAGKPARFMALMDYHHPRVPRHEVTPITKADLYRVHDKAWVDSIFAGDTANGFGNFNMRVPESTLWTIGSLYGAMEYAAVNALPACSPTSGFHHAMHAEAGGYCTFNGLMVAAAKYLDAHPGHTVGILDCDFHYGNGTADILERFPELNGRIVHRTSGKYFHEDDKPQEFFVWLNASIADINRSGCVVTLYQAGADMHIDDPLGGLLTSREMMRRDQWVFNGIHSGIAWNLAGGYRKGFSIHTDPTLGSHLTTVGEANKSDGRRLEIFKYNRSGT